MLTLRRKQSGRKVEDIQEIASHPASLNVDRENHVIKGVKLLGLESQNNNSYQDFALQEGRDLYEGAACNIDHPDKPTGVRAYRDKLGVIKNVQYKQNDGLYGDLFYNPKHALVENVLWDAENDPSRLGMSPNHQVTSRPGPQGNRIINKINKVRSVDLVPNPATTHGLFEHEEDKTMTTLADLLEQATPRWAKRFAELLEQDGIEVTAPIDVLGEMSPVEAVKEAMAQTAMEIFKDESITPEETGQKVAELATVVEEVKTKVEPGSSAPTDEDPPAEDGEGDGPPADGEEEEKTEGVLEKSIASLSKQVGQLYKQSEVRNVLESRNVPVNAQNIADLMECKTESAMLNVVESWSGQRRGLPRPRIGTVTIERNDVPKKPEDFKGRYASK